MKGICFQCETIRTVHCHEISATRAVLVCSNCYQNYSSPHYKQIANCARCSKLKFVRVAETGSFCRKCYREKAKTEKNRENKQLKRISNNREWKKMKNKKFPCPICGRSSLLPDVDDQGRRICARCFHNPNRAAANT